MDNFLISKFREEVSKSKDYRMKVETEFPVSYPTGFLNFDFLNGMVTKGKLPDGTMQEYKNIGIQDGSLNMIIGRSASGKTTWTIQAAANMVRPFPASCIYHDDIEGGINETRKMQLAQFTEEEFKSKYLSRNTGITAENFYERVKMIHDIKINNRAEFEYDTGMYDSFGERIFKLAPTVYILDSLALLMPEKFSDEEEMSGQMSATATAKMNKAIMTRVIPMLKAANIILFVINHILEDVSINPMMKKKAQISYLKQGETLPGGKAPIYLSNNIIRFDDNTKLKETEGFGFSGSLVDIGLVKSRTNRAGQAATLIFNQREGFDPVISLFIMLKNAKRVNGAGAYLYLGDRSDIKFAQKNFKKTLIDKPELQQVFQAEVLSCLEELLSPPVQENKIEMSNVVNNMLAAINAPVVQ